MDKIISISFQEKILRSHKTIFFIPTTEYGVEETIDYYLFKNTWKY